MKEKLYYQTQGKKDSAYSSNRKQFGIQQDRAFYSLNEISFLFLLEQFGQKLEQLFVLLCFWFHKATFGFFQHYQVSWSTISLFVFAVFVFLQKDLNFQVQMNAPGGVLLEGISSEEMSIAQPVRNFFTNATVSKLSVASFDEVAVKTYIQRFASVAIGEQEKFGIPASIKLAQGIIESQAGDAKATKVHNNHFGKPLAEGQYNNAWENWRAHSQFLMASNGLFKGLLRYGIDYKSWAAGLQQLNYSSIGNYDELLIQLIERYELHQLDAT